MALTISLERQHLSIGTLVCPVLPDFAVLTGRNGAGKTQLLHALMERHAVVPGIPQHEIELYDMFSFSPPNNRPGNRHSNQFARKTASDYLHGTQGPPPVTIAAEIFDRYTAEIERECGMLARQLMIAHRRCMHPIRMT